MTLPKGYGDPRKRDEERDKWLIERRDKLRAVERRTAIRRGKIALVFLAILTIAIVLIWYGVVMAREAAHKLDLEQDAEMIANGCEPVAKNDRGIVTAWRNCSEVPT